MTFLIMTLLIMTLLVMTLLIMTLLIMTLYDNSYNIKYWVTLLEMELLTSVFTSKRLYFSQ